jgi:hypothetical protein
VCFVICPIGEAKSDTRIRSDFILSQIIRPVVADFGLKAVRADEIANPGRISNHMLDYIHDSTLVIADLTGGNPNVFYELAIRHGLNKPVIQLIQTESKIPFDVADILTVIVDHRKKSGVEVAKKSIRSQIRAMERDPFLYESPVFTWFGADYHQVNTHDCTAISRIWRGEEIQHEGLGDSPVHFTARLTLKASRRRVAGEYYVKSKAPLNLAATFQVNGGFLDSHFLKLDYRNSEPGVQQFGTLLLVWDAWGRILKGQIIGSSAGNKKIAHGSVDLKVD